MKPFFAFFCLLLFSCASVPKEERVPQDMEVIDLIQKAQEAFEVNNYRGAKKWYEIILHRFGDDVAVLAEAKYELAHILVKQKKWKKAYVHLKSLIEMYEAKEGRRLPQDFYKLAKMDYEKVLKKLSFSYIESVARREDAEKAKRLENNTSDSLIETGEDDREDSEISLEEAESLGN